MEEIRISTDDLAVLVNFRINTKQVLETTWFIHDAQ